MKRAFVVAFFLGLAGAGAFICRYGKDDIDPYIAAASIVLGAYGVWRGLFGELHSSKGTGKPPISPLDTPLFQWSENDPFTVRDLLSGGVSIMGRAGSGKTSGSGKLFGESIVALKNSGGLILAAKPEDLAMWQGVFQKAARPDDLLVFGPDSPLRFNFTNYEMLLGGHTRNITKTLMTIGEALRGNDTKGGENADFWEKEQNRLLHHAIEIVKLATGKVDAWDLQQFITNAAQFPDQVQDPEWIQRSHAVILREAHNKQKMPQEEHDYNLAIDYWLIEYPAMDQRTRSNVNAGDVTDGYQFQPALRHGTANDRFHARIENRRAGQRLCLRRDRGAERRTVFDRRQLPKGGFLTEMR